MACVKRITCVHDKVMLRKEINHSVALAMDEFQSTVAGTVISFTQRRPSAAAALAFASCLTARDRMDIFDWQEAAKVAGYDRMVIHDRDYGDAQEVGNFLSVYRHGESWSRWGFARQGRTISSWCCLTSMDMGRFASLRDALGAVLNVSVPGQVGSMMVPVNHHGAVVTELAARRKACVASMGSAA